MAQSGTGTTDHTRVIQDACSEMYGRTRDVKYLKALDALIEAMEVVQQYPEHPLRTALLQKLGVGHGGWA